MALFAEDIPQHYRIALRLPGGDANFRQPRQQFLALLALRGNAGQIAFDIRHKYRHADSGEGFSQLLQRHGFAGAGRAGDESVAIRHRGQKVQLHIGRLGNKQRGGHRFTLRQRTLSEG